MEQNYVNYVPTSTEKKKMDIVQIILMVACAINVLGCILPFGVVDILGYTDSVTWIEGDGVIAIILLVATCGLSFLKNKVIAIIPAVINLLITLYDVINLNDVTDGIGEMGSGAYIVLIGSIAVAALTVVLFVRSKNNK